MNVLGIDIGGSGIKGAIVNVNKGELASERFRLLTPQPARPIRVAGVVAKVAAHFNWNGLIGCTFPGIIREGTVYSAANVDPSWIGRDGQTLFENKTGCPVVLLNDADAAGMAEMAFGAGHGQAGLVVMLTLGTGIGSGLYFNGQLVPNAELGHIEMNGVDAETRVSDRARQEEQLSWRKWAKRLNAYLVRIEFLISPDLFILGGGISKEHEKFLPYIDLRTPIVPARFLNQAGIIGAALAASKTKPS